MWHLFSKAGIMTQHSPNHAGQAAGLDHAICLADAALHMGGERQVGGREERCRCTGKRGQLGRPSQLSAAVQPQLLAVLGQPQPHLRLRPVLDAARTDVAVKAVGREGQVLSIALQEGGGEVNGAGKSWCSAARKVARSSVQYRMQPPRCLLLPAHPHPPSPSRPAPHLQDGHALQVRLAPRLVQLLRRLVNQRDVGGQHTRLDDALHSAREGGGGAGGC